MQNTTEIKADYLELDKVRRGFIAGISIEHKGKRGRKETLWVDKACTFQKLPAGIEVSRQFTGENEGRGFRVLVAPTCSGILTFIDANVMTGKA